MSLMIINNIEFIEIICSLFNKPIAIYVVLLLYTIF